MKKSIVIGIIVVMGVVLCMRNSIKQKEMKKLDEKEENVPPVNVTKLIPPQTPETEKWELRLVNYENCLPEDFEIELADIDNIRQFDARAIKPLKEMLNALKIAGITNVWVQSAYRSVEHQKELFEHKIDTYVKQGKSREEAEKLTLQTINKPGTSEHNLGLAVDFNYVDYRFDTTKGFLWLQENAENYGFILRYPKEKESITKVDYEPWHWRYVGVEHAKKINEQGFCLEEYCQQLKNKKDAE